MHILIHSNIDDLDKAVDLLSNKLINGIVLNTNFASQLNSVFINSLLASLKSFTKVVPEAQIHLAMICDDKIKSIARAIEIYEKFPNIILQLFQPVTIHKKINNKNYSNCSNEYEFSTEFKKQAQPYNKDIEDSWHFDSFISLISIALQLIIKGVKVNVVCESAIQALFATKCGVSYITIYDTNINLPKINALENNYVNNISNVNDISNISNITNINMTKNFIKDKDNDKDNDEVNEYSLSSSEKYSATNNFSTVIYSWYHHTKNINNKSSNIVNDICIIWENYPEIYTRLIVQLYDKEQFLKCAKLGIEFCIVSLEDFTKILQ